MADSDRDSGSGPNSNNNNNNPNSEFSSSPKEQDRFLPIANVSRIMKKGLPANAKISKDAKETMQECVSEFISFVTGEASDKCQKEKRKTINGDDLLWAMTTLGFEDYVEPLKGYLQRFREVEGERTGFVGRPQTGTDFVDGSSVNSGNSRVGLHGGGMMESTKMMMMGSHPPPPPPPPPHHHHQFLHHGSHMYGSGSGGASSGRNRDLG